MVAERLQLVRLTERVLRHDTSCVHPRVSRATISRSGKVPAPTQMSDLSTLVPPEQFDDYRIVRSLGSGSMGTVFLGHDLRLDRPVAIKFIAAANPSARARDRFLREARAIARLSHPNVVAVYRAGEVEGRPYLVSEYLSGQTLDQVTLPPGEPAVLRVAQGLCRGLSAAHGAGVLHRDIKPGNVIITPGGQPKLLDFGLAKLMQELPPSGFVETEPGSQEGSQEGSSLDESVAEAAQRPELTSPGVILGTPSYLAPEIWAGEGASERSDLYSLGALLYELCAGRPPFQGSSIGDLRRAALASTPQPLRELAPGLDARLCAIIDRCLERDASQRPASAGALLGELDSLAEALCRAEEAPGARRGGLAAPGTPSRRWAAVSLLLLSLAALGIGVRWHRARPGPAAAPEGAARRTIAVLGFKSLSGEPSTAWYGVALTELLSAELAAGEHLRAIPGESVARMKIELGLQEADGYAADTLQRIRRNLGSDIVVFGAYLALGAGDEGQLRATVKLQQTENGEVITAATASGRRGELMDLATRLGSSLRARLGLSALSGDASQGLAATRPKNPDVARLYSAGLDRLRRFDPLAARDLLDQAVAADPDYPLAHAALAEVYKTLGYQQKAKEAARRANERAGGLPREDRLLVEARYRASIGETDKAVEIYRTLFTLFPDNVDAGLLLAEAQMAANRPRDALQTARGLRLLPAPAREDPRVDIAIGQAAYAFSDLTSAKEALERAVAQGRARGSPILVARALRMQGWTAQNLGDHRHGLELVEEARRLFNAAGDRYGEADACADLVGRYWSGEGAAGLGALEEALRIYQEVGNREAAVAVGINMGNLLVRHGQLRLARIHVENGLLLGRELERKEMVGAGLVVQGWIATLEGRGREARAHLAEAVTMLTELGDQVLLAWARFHQGELLAQEDRLAEARRAHEESLAIRQRIHAEMFVGESQVALAALALEQGRRDEAEVLARQALSFFEKKGARENEAMAAALLGRALIDKGRREEAQGALRRATAWTSTRGWDALVRLSVALIAARVRAGGGERSQVQAARAALERSLAEAREAGILSAEMEARLVLAELDQAAGQPARARLLELAREAARLGFLRIARKAAEARGR